MKKICILMLALVLSSTMMAKEFVGIPYTNQSELEKIFNDSNLTVHFYTNNIVFATATNFDASTMVLIDQEAFSDNKVYTLVYCPESEQAAYLQNKTALFQTANYVIVKGAVIPYKNDGAVAIHNKEARLPRLTRDFPQVTEENPVIRQMLDQVSQEELEANVQHLQDYGSRLWNTTGAYSASDWIASQMRALGMEVEQQPFEADLYGLGPMLGDDPAPNVIAIQRGTKYPNTYVVCGSHFDSFSFEAMLGMGTAPGADDNASGTSTVLESARVLSQYEFEYSIVYCSFGTEELGLYGSEAYAARCQQQGMDIIGFFNNDMNGYLRSGDPIHIDLIYPNTVEPIADFYRAVGGVYCPDVPLRHVTLDEGDSDHTSFCNHGYMGIFPFEDYENYSPNIHTPQDLIGPSVNDFANMQRFCQMNIACLAECARPIASSVEETSDSEALVYPNPAKNQVNIVANGLQRITVYNAMGQLLKTIEVGGQDQFVMPLDDYATGLYTLQMVTEKGVVSKSVLVK